jgi:hypothetical protein
MKQLQCHIFKSDKAMDDGHDRRKACLLASSPRAAKRTP